ncbi:hypothetical protein ACP4OV_022173 [Aristida adscensionis]
MAPITRARWSAPRPQLRPPAPAPASGFAAVSFSSR